MATQCNRALNCVFVFFSAWVAAVLFCTTVRAFCNQKPRDYYIKSMTLPLSAKRQQAKLHMITKKQMFY
jgi:hypothetical protein